MKFPLRAGVCAAWLAVCAGVAAQMPTPPPDPPVRALEVFKDELPDTIAPGDLTVVIEGSTEQCDPQPPRLPLFGSGPLQNFQRATQLVCSRVTSWLSTPREGSAAILMPGRFGDRSASAAMAAAKAAGARTRYTVVVRWHADFNNRIFTWHTEEAGFDDERGAWIWHAVRRFDLPIYDQIPAAMVARDLAPIVSSYVGETLGTGLRARAAVRQPANALQARWESPQALRQPPDAGLARVVVVGDYASPNDWLQGDARTVLLSRVPLGGDPGSVLQATAARFSFQSFQVAPGLYEAWTLSGVERRNIVQRELAAGSEWVLRVVRNFGNATGLEVQDRAWLDEALGRRLRHGFLADPRGPNAYSYSPWFSRP